MTPRTSRPSSFSSAGTPGHELETEPVIDHGEAAGGERHPLPIDARDVLAFGCGLIGEASLGRELRRRVVQFPPPQGGEEIAREDHALPLPACEPFLREMIDARLHGVAHLGAEPASAERRVLGEELAVEPGRPRRRHLRLDRKIRAGGERQATTSVRVVVDPRLDDGSRRRIAGHLEIGEPEMMGAPIDASDDRVGASPRVRRRGRA